MAPSNEHSRRGFLKNAAVAGAASLATGTANADPVYNRRLKIGAIGVGEYSFTTFSWSDIIEPDKPANNPRNSTMDTSFLNMDFTHCWDVNPEAAQKFAARMDGTAVKRYDEMVGKVDGIIFGGLYEAPWQCRLAHPYVEAGIPVYLSRPFAYRLRDLDDLLDLAAEKGTPIMATAKYEHYKEAPALKAKLAKLGQIRCVHATCNTPDYPVHFHLQFMMMRILGYDVDTVSVQTDDLMRNNYLQTDWIYKGWENQHPFPLSMQGLRNSDQFTISIFGSNHTETASMLRSPDWQDGLYFRYAPQILAMQRTFEGNQLEPLENIRKKTAIFLAGLKSFYENNGGPVKVDSVSPDWTAPFPMPGWIDDSIFR